MRWLLILSALSYVGCATGAASLVLRSPVEEKCRDLKLKSCDKLADGVVLYVDGGYMQTVAPTKPTKTRTANRNEPIQVNVRLSPRQVEALDEWIEQANAERGWPKLTRTDVIRNLLAWGLAERPAWATGTETK